jgi:tetratricopeptide (TPR) repeat protein
MMKHKPGLFFIAIIVILLAGCNSAATSKATATPVATTPSLAPPSKWEPTDTPNRLPTATHPQLAPTSTATTPQRPQTLRNSCTTDRPDLLPTFAIPPDDPIAITDFEPQPILDFLNAGGSQQAVIDYIKKSARLPDEFLLQNDLTGDSIPELIVVDWHLRIYTCKNQQYYTATDIEADTRRDNPIPVLFQDMNQDGFPEILVEVRYKDSVDVSYGYQILGWNGHTFQNLISPEEYSNYNLHTYMTSEINGGWVQVNGSNWAFDAGEPLPANNEQWEVRDIDHNGAQEVILTGGIFVDRHIELNAYGHQRKTKTTLMWDGKHFVIQDTEYGPAEFRFQAVQDADYATLKGQYNKALNLYQQVISSNTLDWWSDARGKNNVAHAEASWNAAPTPTLPAPDLTEREYLSSYAYYRIMVLKVLQGETEQAKNTFQTLRAIFPAGKPGSTYTELAAAFWNTYETTQNIENACHAAINYANANKSATLHYIGERNYHPWPSLDYQPDDICPFK